MDTRAADREVIEKVLADYAAIPYAHGDVVTQTVFDRASDHYLLMILGSENERRVHGCLVHIHRIDDKIWIQADGTERGMAPALVRGDIPPDRIILAFSSDGPLPLLRSPRGVIGRCARLALAQTIVGRDATTSR